uniref:Uncharacterized protein n=1 Tax=Anguilla anguilla TaxID=7936 RepID=A0A0E9W9R7_ANGAN
MTAYDWHKILCQHPSRESHIVRQLPQMALKPPLFRERSSPCKCSRQQHTMQCLQLPHRQTHRRNAAI